MASDSMPLLHANQLQPPQQPGEQPHFPQQSADQPYQPPGYQPGYTPCQNPDIQVPVITQQPACQQISNTTVVVNQQVVPAQRTTRNWSSGLCGCCDDCDSCKYPVELFLCDHLSLVACPNYQNVPSQISIFVTFCACVLLASRPRPLWAGVLNLHMFSYYRNRKTRNSKTHTTVDFGVKRDLGHVAFSED